MGNGNIKKNCIRKNELKELTKLSSLTDEMIRVIHSHFLFFSGVKKDDGMIDYDEFLTIINKKDNLLAKKLFKAIDTNKDNKINFKEFIKFISCFINGSFEEQCEMSFRIFKNTNLSGDCKVITCNKEFIVQLLKSAISDERVLSDYLDMDLDEGLIEEVVSATFKDFINQEELSYQNYKDILRQNEFILNWFKIDLSKIKEFRKDRSKSCCF
jgi:Ca2+-binding EF-hand superfamily protein